MYSLERFSNNSSYSQKIWSFCSPISWRPSSILFSSKDNKRMPFFDISKSCVTDIKDLSSGNICSLRSKLWSKFVNYSCVSKSSSSHNLVISSSSSICIKISLFDSSLHEISGCRWLLGYLSSRRNMVCSNRVTKTAKYISLLDILYFGQLEGCIFEEGWIMNVSWWVFPIVLIALLNFKSIPSLSSFWYFVID